VTLLGPDPRGSPLAGKATGSDGAYAVSVGRPEDVRVVEVRKSGFAPGRISLEYRPGQVHHFEIESARPVSGRVRFGDGRPVTQGRTWVLEKREVAVPGASFPVQEDGSFLGAAQGNEIALLVVGDDFQPRLSGLIDLRGPDEPRADIEVEPARTLIGIVQDTAGRPIAGARVQATLSLSEAEEGLVSDLELESPYGDPLHTLGLTDAEGRFSVGGLGPEPARVLAEADGFIGAEIEAGDGPAIFTLNPVWKPATRTLTVAVARLPPGEKLPDHAYLVGRGYHELMKLEGEIYTFSDFSTEAGKGSIQVPGYERVRVEWPEGTEAHHLGEIRLARGRVLEVSVTDDEGQGIAGASVTVDPGSNFCGVYDGVTNVRFETDGQGILSLGGLWDKGHRLGIEKDGFIARDLYIDLDKHSGVLEVVLARKAHLKGRVLGPDGEPLLRALVVAVVHDDEDYSGDLTDWTGAFLVRVPAGRKLQGIIYSAGAAPTPFEIPPLSAGEPWDAGELQVLPGETLAGVALDDEGRPLARESLSIKIVKKDEDSDPVIRHWGELPGADTDDAGLFEFRGLLPGKYRLTVYLDDRSTQERLFSVPTAGPVVFALDDPSFRTYGGVVRDADGAPVAGATVTLGSRVPRDEHFYEDVTTQKDGRFRIRSIPLDLVLPVLRVSHGFGGRTLLGRSVSELPDEIVLERGCSLAIRVEKEAGAGQQELPWLRLLKDGQGFGGVNARENGTLIRAEDVPQGSYEGIVAARGYLPVGMEIEVRHDQPFTASVTLRRFPPEWICSFQVKSSKGTPLKDAWVMSELSRNGRQRVFTDDDGMAALTLVSGVDNGVAIRLEGYYPVRLNPGDIGERREVEVVLHPNGGVRAQVTIPGDPRDIDYYFQAEPLDVPRWRDYWRDGIPLITEPGEHSIPNLPAGRYALVVSNDGVENEDWIVAREEITVTDGTTTEIHLELPAHFQIRGVVTERGRPVAGKQIYLSSIQDGRGYLVGAKLDDAGRFSRSACVAGKYAISMALDGELRALGEREITGDVDLRLELER
jgi:protocatechuate 3,4-dioxygenase beta subunit